LVIFQQLPGINRILLRHLEHDSSGDGPYLVVEKDDKSRKNDCSVTEAEHKVYELVETFRQFKMGK
jgi:hypothetical protein